MKLRFKRMQRRYVSMHKSGKGRIKKHPYVLPILGICFGFVVVCVAFVSAGGQTYGASDSHVVNLAIDGETQVLPTRVKTVGELVQNLNLELGEADIVEPTKETAIQEDNFNVNIYKAKPITVVDGERKTVTMSALKSPKLVAEQAGVKVYPEDNAQFDRGDIRQGELGERVTIDRATPLMLNLYGTPVEIRTRTQTVKDLLAEKGVKAQDNDTITPAPETPISDGLQIFVTHFGKQVITSEEVMPFTTTFENDPNSLRGTVVLKTPGVAGKKFVTYELELENNVEKSRRVIQEVIAVAPVAEVKIRGTKVPVIVYSGNKADLMAAAGIDPSDYAYVDYIVGRESGWNAGARNSSSGAYGLCQALPGTKMASAGADWATNPVTQLRWCSSYANKYGGWRGAYTFWIFNHWW